MRRLFSIEADGDVTLQDDTFKLVKELRLVYDELGGKYIRYIVLVNDYLSPYRQMPLSKRREEVCEDVFSKPLKKVKDVACDLILDAEAKYKKLQYDPIIEQYMVYTQKLTDYNKYILEQEITNTNSKAISDVMLSVEKITEAREKIKELILKKEEETGIRGGGETSLLEEMLLSE